MTCKPKVRHEFGSIEDAYDFYNENAREIGFSLRRIGEVAKSVKSFP